MATRHSKTIGSFLLVAILQATGVVAYAQDSELRGICESKNTSDQCLIINKSSSTVEQVSWLLEGSDVDYGNDVLVSLRPGQSVMVSNEIGKDNCFFTEETNVTVYMKNGQYKDYYQQLRFDSNDSCILVVK